MRASKRRDHRSHRSRQTLTLFSAAEVPRRSLTSQGVCSREGRPLGGPEDHARTRKPIYSVQHRPESARTLESHGARALSGNNSMQTEIEIGTELLHLCTYTNLLGAPGALNGAAAEISSGNEVRAGSSVAQSVGFSCVNLGDDQGADIAPVCRADLVCVEASRNRNVPSRHLMSVTKGLCAAATPRPHKF